jgi:hypothetical protein
LYKSLKSWVNLPATLKKYVGRTGTGDKQFGPSISIKCYAEGKVSVVSDFDGKEVVSNKRLFIDGSIRINPLDVIYFEERDHDIKSINYYYSNGKIDMQVVYL